MDATVISPTVSPQSAGRSGVAWSPSRETGRAPNPVASAVPLPASASSTTSMSASTRRAGGRGRTGPAPRGWSGPSSAGCAHGATRPSARSGRAARPISLLVWPSAIRRRISTSRSVSPSGGPAGSAGAAASCAPSFGFRYVSPAAAAEPPRPARCRPTASGRSRARPARIASRAKAGSFCIVSTTTGVSGDCARSSGIAGRLDPSGRFRSSTSTRGWCART